MMETFQKPGWSVLLCGLSLMCGCAVSSVAERATAFRLPPSKLSPDSVVLEVAQLSIPADDEEWTDIVWTELDEQVLSCEMRRALIANGIRVGIAGSRLPDAVYQELGRLPDADDTQPTDVLAETMNLYRRVQLRSGARSDIVMRGPMETMVSFAEIDDGVTGQSLDLAQPQFAMVATPRGDGSVSLQLTPEIHYGQSKQKFVGENGVFHIEAGRDQITYDDLAITADLASGQTLVVTSAGPKHSIGGNFFQDEREEGNRTLLLIRLAQTQYDDLFGEDI